MDRAASLPRREVIRVLHQLRGSESPRVAKYIDLLTIRVNEVGGQIHPVWFSLLLYRTLAAFSPRTRGVVEKRFPFMLKQFGKSGEAGEKFSASALDFMNKAFAPIKTLPAENE